ncbi:MAG: hypothetical protein A2X12_02820, partial [Bacteroidetes bacterium GWE2_29_8]
MLQRKQSIFILLAIITGVIMLFSPLYFYSAGGLGYTFKCFEISQLGVLNKPVDVNILPLGIVAFFAVLQSILALFSFKKLKLQKNILQFNMLTWITILVIIIYYSNNIETFLVNFQIGAVVSKPDIGTFLPIIAYVFLFIANRGVKKDEEL